MSDAKHEITIYDATKTGELIQPAHPITARNAPAIVKVAGKPAEFAWEEFFQAEIANAHTRKNYMHAVRQFLAWVEERNLELPRISPGDVGEYLQALELATPTKKLHLAALRRFFDRLVNRHVCVINPAATVKAERHSVVEGKTPDIGPTQARALLKSIAVTDPVGLRDRAVLAVLIYTAARVGAVAKLTMKNFVNDGSQYTLRFAEKGGKSREIPVRHDLVQFLVAYVQSANITDGPLFRTANRKSKTLTKNPMTGIDICRMMKRHLKSAGLPGHFSPHSFRVTTVTDLLEQNVPLEDVQYLAGHADPRTTRIYDRRRRKVTRNIADLDLTMATGALCAQKDAPALRCRHRRKCPRSTTPKHPAGAQLLDAFSEMTPAFKSPTGAGNAAGLADLNSGKNASRAHSRAGLKGPGRATNGSAGKATAIIRSWKSRWRRSRSSATRLVIRSRFDVGYRAMCGSCQSCKARWAAELFDRCRPMSPTLPVLYLPRADYEILGGVIRVHGSRVDRSRSSLLAVHKQGGRLVGRGLPFAPHRATGRLTCRGTGPTSFRVLSSVSSAGRLDLGVGLQD